MWRWFYGGRSHPFKGGTPAWIAGLLAGLVLHAYDVVPSVTDFQADPRFVDPAGADGVLGAAGFEDDNFHLQSDSGGIDAGSATAARLGIDGSAVAGDDGDEGIVDLGFHYPTGSEGSRSSSPAARTTCRPSR